MRNAPSVSYPVGRCHLAGWFVAAVALAGSGLLAGWALAGLSGWRAFVAPAVLLATVAMAAAAWWRSPEGRVAWDSAGEWRWHPAKGDPGADGEPGRLHLTMDLQSWVLARWRPATAGRARWFWLEAQRDPPGWRALRRAVYSPAGTEPARVTTRSPAAEP